MIVTGEMNHSMQNQSPQLRAKPVRATPRISPGRFRRNYNISDVLLRPDSPRPPQRTRAAIFRPPHWEREYVGRSLFVSKFTIHARHGRIAHETDGDAFIGESKLALHAFAEPGQRFYS